MKDKKEMKSSKYILRQLKVLKENEFQETVEKVKPEWKKVEQEKMEENRMLKH